MTKNKDAAFEALLRQAVIDDYNEELASYPTNIELKELYPVSDRQRVRMDKLLADIKKKERRQSVWVVARRVAVIAMAAAALFFAVVLAGSPEASAAVEKAAVQFSKEYALFAPNTSDEEFVFDNAWRPSYIPEGYVLDEDRIFDTISMFSQVYYNDKGTTIYFSYSTTTAGQATVDSEGKLYAEINIDGVVYHSFIVDPSLHIALKENIIVWERDGHRFTLISTLDIAELLTMAKSIQK
jgi:hypothetical protein